jgi:hypothetical protein
VATAANAVATTLTAVSTIVFTTLQIPSHKLPQNPLLGFFFGGGFSNILTTKTLSNPNVNSRERECVDVSN